MIWMGSSPPRILMQRLLLRGSAAPGCVRATAPRGCCACSRRGSTAALHLPVSTQGHGNLPAAGTSWSRDSLIRICKPWVAPGEPGRGLAKALP